MEDKIDILMPTYNGEKYVAEQIESILNQNYNNFRLLISDDFSNDNTREILEEYRKKDDRVIVFLQEKNLGVVKNIEFLLKNVQSKYYMLSDQDDFWLPEKIEKSLEKLKLENADLVFGDLEVVDENLKTIYPSFSDYMNLSRKIKKCINSDRLNYLYNCITGCTILAKSKLIKKVLPIPINSKMVIHDYWIGLVYSLNGKITYLDEKYIKYRQHGDNQIGTNHLSHKFNKFFDVRNHFINVKFEIFDTYVKNNDIFSKELQELNIKALNYFKSLKSRKYCNFSSWNIFYKLYKDESFLFYIENFMILNIPILVIPVFYIRYFILKLLKER